MAAALPFGRSLLSNVVFDIKTVIAAFRRFQKRSQLAITEKAFETFLLSTR
jgi:hypothetical protein